MQEKLDRNIPVMRHFDDIDDLLNFDRDGNLIPGQEAKALLIAEELISEVKKEEKRAIMFVCSSKRRATQTAHLVADEIRKIDNKMKVRVVQQDGLSAIDQGKFILPADYKIGGQFLGLELANKIFSKEVFGSASGNLLYKFGDPVLQSDGTYKYPELVPYFESYGESNRDLLLRLYDLVIRTSKKMDKFGAKTKVVVVTHAQLYQIFRDLSTVAEMVTNGGLDLQEGELPKLCWELYSKRFKNEKPTYGVNYISIENLFDPKVVELLNREIEYLKSLK